MGQPNAENVFEPTTLNMNSSTFFMPRSESEYEAKYQGFMLKKKSFGQQYSQIYNNRLNLLRPVLLEKCSKSKMNIVPKIIDLETNVECVIIGTVYKEMLCKPCVLDEITEESNVGIIESKQFSSDEDTLVLEDESGRVAITNISVNSMVTGVILGVSGKVDEEGIFKCISCWSPGYAPQAAIPKSMSSKYIVLLSGLGFGKNTNPMAAQLVVEYISGLVGNESAQRGAGDIVRVVIAGNLTNGNNVQNALSKNDANKRAVLDREAEAMQQADLWLAQLTSCVHVDIMPGATDAASNMLPQQPLHHCLFPYSSRFSSFRSVSNPYYAAVDGIELLGTSGENISSMKQCTQNLSELECMQQTLEWRHLAPTAPDSLHCYPSSDTDPFVLQATPHVYFAGNQPSFQTNLVQLGTNQNVRVISIPDFSATGTMVLLNTSDLSVKPIQFSI